jgi:ActR/RegA family two-component response regulator
MTHAVYIVDADAKGLAADLNNIAKREGHAVRYIPALTPDLLFEEMKAVPARLILLHHTWSGLTIAQVLERIKNATTDVRVVVFTGREPNMPELIECVRFGVCDYWLKSGSIDPIAWSRQISNYCDSSSYTLDVLARTSGSVMGLLKEAESNSGRVKGLEIQIRGLEKKLQQKTSALARDTRKSIARGVEYIVCISVLALVFLILASQTSVKAAGIMVGIFLLFFLFLQGKIAEAIIDWGRKRVVVSSSNDSEESSGEVKRQ